jgi:hypothetical protein
VLTTSRCGRLEDAYYHAGYPLTGNVLLLTVALSAIPVLIGMFVAVPLPGLGVLGLAATDRRFVLARRGQSNG